METVYAGGGMSLCKGGKRLCEGGKGLCKGGKGVRKGGKGIRKRRKEYTRAVRKGLFGEGIVPDKAGTASQRIGTYQAAI